MLRCDECQCVSREGRGWLRVLGGDPKDRLASSARLCPVCAQRVLGLPSAPEGYT